MGVRDVALPYATDVITHDVGNHSLATLPLVRPIAKLLQPLVEVHTVVADVRVRQATCLFAIRIPSPACLQFV